MLRTLKRRIYRNRRRALICFAGFFAFSILKSIDNGTLGDLGMSLFVAIALGLIMTVLLGTLALIINKWRALMEITAVASILIALFGLLAPALETTLPPWAHIGLVWAATFGFGSFYGGTLLDTYTRREKVTLHGRARSTLPVETVWTGLFGLPAEVAQRYDADDVMVYEPVADEPNTYRVVERLPDGIGQIEEHQTYLLRDAPPQRPSHMAGALSPRWHAILHRPDRSHLNPHTQRRHTFGRDNKRGCLFRTHGAVCLGGRPCRPHAGRQTGLA